MFKNIKSAKKGITNIKSIKIGTGNRGCSNCGKSIPARISKCCYCDHVYYLVSPKTAKIGHHPEYTNIMTPKQELEAVLERTGYQFDSLTKRKVVKEMKHGGIYLSGRKLVISVESLANIINS